MVSARLECRDSDSASADRSTSVPAGRGRDARSIVALQRSAGNRAVARMLRRGAAVEGKGRNPGAPELEELEGHDELALRLARAVLHRQAARKLQRLEITQHHMSQGNCGQRNVQWVFSLSSPAPEDGYIVQHIQASEDTAVCPAATSGTMKQTQEFWEAWLVKKGDKVDWTTTRDAWTDGSTRPARPGERGEQVSAGTLKFFKKSTTGDLGDFNVAPADASSAWGPGKVATSGALPSTPTKPAWWDGAAVEGPVTREARSRWDCCDPDAAKHASVVTAKPVPAAAPPPAAKPPRRWWQFWRWFE